MRQWPPITDGYSENFASLNRNKRSVVARPQGSRATAELARRLALEADVVVENNRPGVMDRLGLGYERLSAARSPRSSTARSRRSARRARARPRAASTSPMQACGGVMSVTGEAERRAGEVRRAALGLRLGALRRLRDRGALRRVRAGGAGAHIDVPMFGCTLAHRRAADERVLRHRAQPAQARLGASAQRAVPGVPRRRRLLRDRRRQRQASGEAWSAVGSEPELAEDPRFATPTRAPRNQAALKEILEAALREHDVAHWLAASGRRACRTRRSTATPRRSPIRRSRHMGWVQDDRASVGHANPHLRLADPHQRQEPSDLAAPARARRALPRCDAADRSARRIRSCSPDLRRLPMRSDPLADFVQRLEGIVARGGRDEGAVLERGEAGDAGARGLRRLAARAVHPARPAVLPAVPAPRRPARTASASSASSGAPGSRRRSTTTAPGA